MLDTGDDPIRCASDGGDSRNYQRAHGELLVFLGYRQGLNRDLLGCVGTVGYVGRLEMLYDASAEVAHNAAMLDEFARRELYCNLRRNFECHLLNHSSRPSLCRPPDAGKRQRRAGLRVARYLQILEDAKIVSRCARFDLRSRKSLRGEQKYYLADLGFHFALNTDNRIDYGPVLENIVHRYALAQGCKVSVGRVGKLECDFILRNPEMVYAYVQVAMTIMADRATEEREYRPFTQIKDDYPKYLLTRSDPIQQRDGIIHANIPEFMQEGRAF